LLGKLNQCLTCIISAACSYGDDDDDGDKEVVLVNTVELAEGMGVSHIDWNSTGFFYTTYR